MFSAMAVAASGLRSRSWRRSCSRRGPASPTRSRGRPAPPTASLPTAAATTRPSTRPWLRPRRVTPSSSHPAPTPSTCMIDKDITLAGDGPARGDRGGVPRGRPGCRSSRTTTRARTSVSFPVVLQASDATLPRSHHLGSRTRVAECYVIGGEPTLDDLSVVPHPDVQISGDDSDPEFMALEFWRRIEPGRSKQLLDRHAVQRRIVAHDRGQHGHRRLDGDGWSG